MTAIAVGTEVLFVSTGSEDGFPKEHAVSGTTGTVARVLDSTEVDVEDVGNMYAVVFDRYIGYPSVLTRVGIVDAFEDELTVLHPDEGEDTADSHSLSDTEVAGFRVGDKVRIACNGERPSPYVGDFPKRVHTVKGFIVSSDGAVCATFSEVSRASSYADMSCELRGLVKADWHGL